MAAAFHYGYRYPWIFQDLRKKKTIFSCAGLGRPVGGIGGPPAFRVITMVDMDVLEQWWLARLGLSESVAAAAPLPSPSLDQPPPAGRSPTGVQPRFGDAAAPATARSTGRPS